MNSTYEGNNDELNRILEKMGKLTIKISNDENQISMNFHDKNGWFGKCENVDFKDMADAMLFGSGIFINQKYQNSSANKSVQLVTNGLTESNLNDAKLIELEVTCDDVKH